MLNKIYLAIKAWILVQLTSLKNWWLSLFSEQANQPNTNPADETELDSGNEYFFQDIEIDYREIPDIDNNLQKEEQLFDTASVVSLLEGEQAATPAHSTDSESPLPKVSDTAREPVSVENEEASLSSSEHVIPLYDGKYDDIFSTIETPIPSAVVNEEVWDVIKEQLPEGYSIPAPSSMMLYRRKP